MITAKEILAAVMEQIFNCVPGVEIYKGRLEEGFSVPAFLLNLTFAGGAKGEFISPKEKTSKYRLSILEPRMDMGEKTLRNDWMWNQS